MEDIIVAVTAEDEEPEPSVFEGKMPWDQRLVHINRVYPSTAKVDWMEVFRQDPQVMARIIADVAKLENASTGRPGKRPAVAPEDAAQYLRRYQDDDYTILPFKEAFNLLKGDRSIRALAHKVGLTSTMTQRLLEGRAAPTAEMLEQIARSFKKHPSYFIEHRVGYILAILTERFAQVPEASIVPYLKLRGSTEKEWR